MILIVSPSTYILKDLLYYKTGSDNTPKIEILTVILIDFSTYVCSLKMREGDLMETTRLSQGMIQVYTGDGKGKTTAALGLACRAVGHGLKVCMIQFLKGNMEYGEIETAKKLAPYLTIKQMGRGCLLEKSNNPEPEDIAAAQEGVALAHEVLRGGDYDIVILDEITVAVDLGLIDTEAVLRLMDERPPHVELILTGRYATSEIIERADLVTEMVERKHYYQKGIQARPGIEK
jgi:cob(I)alamin adenosyltransferase